MTELKQRWRRLKSDFDNVTRTLRLAVALPGHFRKPITLEQAQLEIKRLLETREDRFLGMVRSEIYGRKGSPYLRLLQYAGCDYADIEAGVRRDGLEVTLAKLAAAGVYLTSEEFKGKIDVMRGSESFRVSPRDFDRRSLSAGFTIESSGTSNRPLRTSNTLSGRSVQAPGRAIFYQAHDLFCRSHAVWEPVTAGRVQSILRNAELGLATERWFAPKVAAHSRTEEWYHRLNAYLVASLGRHFGPGIGSPEYLDPGDLRPILNWLIQKKRQRENCSIATVVSNAAKIAGKAEQAGVDLSHLTLVASGEPLTQAKQRLIAKTGARIALRYGAGGWSGTSYGCGNPRYIDEMHVPEHTFTFVENPRCLEFDGATIHPLMLTSLHPSAPRFQLNVENGDYATMITRDCGCALEKVGFTQHLHSVRSFEKMTSEGMNYSGSELFELMEETMPTEFGGGPGDYQLVEEEDEKGQTRLTLVVHPEIGRIDNEKILSRLREGLAQGSRDHRFMSKIWEDAKTYRLRREVPYSSARGKTLPLRIKPK